jgi:hypothetical protein
VTVKNAIVAATLHVAQQYRDAFGLDRKVWETHGYDAAIMGTQYQRIVMLRPHWQPTAADLAAFEDYVNIHWRPRLDRDATIKII